MKTKSSVRCLWVIVAAQACFLVAWAGYHEAVRHSAATLRLKGAPMDPRDILRGDYMTLSYDISRHLNIDTDLTVDTFRGQAFNHHIKSSARHCI